MLQPSGLFFLRIRLDSKCDEFHSGLIVVFPSRSCLGSTYCLFLFDVQQNACNKNLKKVDIYIQYMDLTAVTCSRSEHLMKHHRDYYGKKSIKGRQ